MKIAIQQGGTKSHKHKHLKASNLLRANIRELI